MTSHDRYPSPQPGPEEPELSLLLDAQLNQLTVNNWIPEDGLPRALARVCNHLNARAEQEDLLNERVRLGGSSLHIPNPHRASDGIAEADFTLLRDTAAVRNRDDKLLGGPASVMGRFVGFHYDIDRSTIPPTGHILAQVALRRLPRTRYADEIQLLASCQVGDEDISLEFLDERRSETMRELFATVNQKVGMLPHLAGSVNGLSLELFHSMTDTIGATELQSIANDVNTLAADPAIRDNPELRDTIEELLRLYLQLPQSLIVHTKTYHISDGDTEPTIQTLLQPKRFGGIEPEVLIVTSNQGTHTELCFVAQTPDGVVHLPWQHIQQLRRQTR